MKKFCIFNQEKVRLDCYTGLCCESALTCFFFSFLFWKPEWKKLIIIFFSAKRSWRSRRRIFWNFFRRKEKTSNSNFVKRGRSFATTCPAFPKKNYDRKQQKFLSTYLFRHDCVSWYSDWLHISCVHLVRLKIKAVIKLSTTDRTVKK
jgi:hypothetical protein